MNLPCGCCEAAAPLTPLVIKNRPGLSSVVYRIGTYASFRESMLTRISALPELASLSTRRSDDYSITILELWAAVADVLTFYQERYANEAFLGTAAQRESVSRLAYLIDYRLGPGVAALARLAFTLDEETQLSLPAGLKVQSVPGADETPQIFETLSALQADAGFNRLRIYPKPVSQVALSKGATESILDRLEGPLMKASLAPGDPMVLFNNGTSNPTEEKKVDSLRVEDDRVVLTWDRPVQKSSWKSTTSAYKTGRTFRLFGNNAPPTYMESIEEGTAPKRIRWEKKTLSDYSYPQHVEEKSFVSGRSRLCLEGKADGLTVGGQLLVNDTIGLKRLVTIVDIDQAQVTLGSLTDTVTRLTVTPALFPSITATFIPIASSEMEIAAGLEFQKAELFEPVSLPFSKQAGGGSFKFEEAPVEFAGFKKTPDTVGPDLLEIAAFVDEVIGPATPKGFSDRRKVLISELKGPAIDFWDFDYPSAVTQSPVYLPGRRVIDEDGPGVEVNLTLERYSFKAGVILRPGQFEIGREVLLLDAEGEPLLATIESAPTINPAGAKAGEFCHLVLSLGGAPQLTLDSASALLLGNVALASHGETVADEIVGSGDATLEFQRMALKKKPLTWLPSLKSAGSESTLQVLVNRVRWKEVPRLFGRSETDQVYSLRTREDGTTEIQFGDGHTGALLPSGASNVVATYRQGLGLAGRVGAGSLTTLLQRLPGLKEVSNPAAAEGGADPESMDHARENAPQTVRTFGRAVSLRDLEDLVKASGEVEKSRATRIWDGLARAVHLTVAAQQGGTFSDEGLKRLATSLTSSRDPNHRLILANFLRVPIEVTATLRVHDDHVQAEVLQSALDALNEALSFDRLQLGQSIHLSDLYRILQEVEGVVSVDIDKLLFKKPSGVSSAQFDKDLKRRGVVRLPDGSPDPMQPRLRIFSALRKEASLGQVIPAEMAWAENPGQDLQLAAVGGL